MSVIEAPPIEDVEQVDFPDAQDLLDRSEWNELPTPPTYEDRRSELEKEIDLDVKHRVLRGIELLKEKYGDDWPEHVDPEVFDIRSGTACVLGQLYGGWEDGCRRLEIYALDSAYGFSTENLGGGRRQELEWSALQDEWLRVLDS